MEQFKEYFRAKKALNFFEQYNFIDYFFEKIFLIWCFYFIPCTFILLNKFLLFLFKLFV
jgi:hypothetical protein